MYVGLLYRKARIAMQYVGSRKELKLSVLGGRFDWTPPSHPR